jgi:hypothetical protein
MQQVQVTARRVPAMAWWLPDSIWEPLRLLTQEFQDQIVELLRLLVVAPMPTPLHYNTPFASSTTFNGPAAGKHPLLVLATTSVFVVLLLPGPKACLIASRQSSAV